MIKFTVTKKDIQKAMTHLNDDRSRSCPIAQALRRQTKKGRVAVGCANSIQVGNWWYHAINANESNRINNLISKFDIDGNCEEATFSIKRDHKAMG